MTDLDRGKIHDAITRDHGLWQGLKTFVRAAYVGNDDDFYGYMRFRAPVEVMIHRHEVETREVNDDGGLVDTWYPATNLLPLPGREEFTVSSIDGPTYYPDGRVEYPQWWRDAQEARIQQDKLRCAENEIEVLKAKLSPLAKLPKDLADEAGAGCVMGVFLLFVCFVLYQLFG